MLLVGLLAAGAQAQPRQYKPAELRRQDSLRHLLRADSRPDTARVNRLYSLGFALRTNDAARATSLLWEAQRLARHLHYPRGLANAEFGLGYCYRASNAYDSALYYTKQATKLYAELNDSLNQTRGLYNLSRIYYERGDYGQALATGLDDLALAQALGYTKGLLFTYTQLGLTNTALGEYATAQQHLTQALALARQLHDPIGTGHAYTALGDLNREQGYLAAARQYYARAATSYSSVYNAVGMLPAELNLVEMTAQLGGYVEARQRAQGLLRRALATGTSGQVERTQLLLATIFLATGRADSARYYGVPSLAASRRHGLKQQALEGARTLALANARLGRWEAAYQAQHLAGDYADSLTNEMTRHRAAALQFTYARSRQQTQIKLLTQQARLQAQQQELARLHYRQQAVALVALILVTSVVLLWRYRRREARRQEALRTRIAADLHDEVGSMLTQISMQSTLLREGRYAPAQQQVYLDQMSEASRRAARQMSDAVWSIDARYDSATSLLDRLRDHAHEVLPPAGIELDFWSDAGLATHTLPLATRQALYYIYKEALHNVIKHAQAQQVQVRLRLRGRQLELEVHDNGLGISTNSRPTGQGLPNMRMRAVAVGGAITFDATGPGTRLVVRLPLR